MQLPITGVTNDICCDITWFCIKTADAFDKLDGNKI